MPTMPIHLRTLLFLLALCIARAAHAQESACGCDDVKSMRNRLCEAQAAISAYGRLISKYREQERRDNKVVLYTKQNYKEDVQPCVQQAIDAVTDGSGVGGALAVTDNVSCDITFFNNPTACMKEIVTSHENVHVTVCQKAKVEIEKEGLWAELKALRYGNRPNQSLIDLMNEERVAYATEITHIRDQFDRLIRTSSCPGLPTRKPGAPERIYTIKPCPPPPPAADKACK
jgi:hypothetical protein